MASAESTHVLFNLLSRMVVLCLMAGLLSGCSERAAGSSPRVKTYKVKGKVTYLGNPIAGASVSFSPQDKQPAAVGRTNDDGEFSLTTYRAGDGAAEGDYKVMIVLTDSEAGSAPAEAHGTTAGVDYNSASGHSATKKKGGGSILPAKYGDPSQTTLTAKVQASGPNEFPFDLK
jgi:hypothetical protein